MAAPVDVRMLREWLHDGRELAVLDVNDGGPYADGHILIASNVPPAGLEVLVRQLVPRRSARVVLTDTDGTHSRSTALKLEAAGYSDVWWLQGGNDAWCAAGHRLFAGSNIVSKAFGELVELRCGTPHLDAHELARWQAEGRRFVLVDARPMAEYRTVSLPGATDCPGAELVYRVPAIVDDPTIPVVVNCAGRTRSIIGAQSLRDAGLANPVFALKNGTMGWQIAGLTVMKGESNIVPEPKGDGLRSAQFLAGGVATVDRIATVDMPTLRSWLGDESRTTYLFDVRQADAFARGHVAGSVNAPGGQLVQNTDTFAAVRHARIVLIDEHHVQAVMTAHWLSLMGWDVAVLDDAVAHMTEGGAGKAPALGAINRAVTTVDATTLRQLMLAGTCEVIDVGESYWYRQGRIPGSWYSKRVGLAESLERFPKNRTLVFACTNGTVSPHIAGDAVALGYADVRCLRDGRAGWRHAGFDVEVIDMDDDDRLLTATDDMWYPPWARKDGALQAMKQYLTWETGLLDLTAEETYLRFRLT